MAEVGPYNRRAFTYKEAKRKKIGECVGTCFQPKNLGIVDVEDFIFFKTGLFSSKFP